MKFYAPYPPPSQKNPFQIPLQSALEEHGWIGHPFIWRPQNIFYNRHKVPILHFHWPESIWRSDSIILSYTKAFWWLSRALLSKSLGYKLVWSAHNVLPHNFTSASLERQLRLWILKNFDLIIGHALNCQDELLKEFGTCGNKYVFAPLGTYESYYHLLGSPQETRKMLKVEDNEHVLLLFGSKQPYKGTDRFISAWNQWHDRNKDLFLVVTGYISDSSLKIIQSLSKCKYLEGYIPDNEIASLCLASDFIAIPYHKITTSSMYFLALTFRKPVIAPDLPFFKQHSAPQTALLYEHQDSLNGIQYVFDQIAHGWQADDLLLEQLAQRYSWSDSATTIANAYDLLLN